MSLKVQTKWVATQNAVIIGNAIENSLICNSVLLTSCISKVKLPYTPYTSDKANILYYLTSSLYLKEALIHKLDVLKLCWFTQREDNNKNHIVTVLRKSNLLGDHVFVSVVISCFWTSGQPHLQFVSSPCSELRWDVPPLERCRQEFRKVWRTF